MVSDCFFWVSCSICWVSKSALSRKSHGTRVTSERIALLKEKYGIATDAVTTDLFDEAGQPAGTQVTIKLPLM